LTGNIVAKFHSDRDDYSEKGSKTVEMLHQGLEVEFPVGVELRKRRAYGRNGIGRHGMFCFADKYIVATKKGGTQSKFAVELSSGEHPFVIRSEKSINSDGFGTSIETEAQRNLPDSDSIRETISARFIHDPRRFRISVRPWRTRPRLRR
jgi:hypothetical protein